MAKNIRRMLAMTLVLCMCVSALPLNALAETTQEPIVNENGETIGQKEVTVTIVPSPSGNGTQTQTDTSWNTQETSQKDPEGSGNVITENKGETQEQETVENKGSETIVSGSSSTQEETIITDTTIQQNQPLEETETALEDMQVTGEKEEYNAPENPDISKEGAWEKDAANSETKYTEGEKTTNSATSKVDQKDPGVNMLIVVPKTEGTSSTKTENVYGSVEMVNELPEKYQELANQVLTQATQKTGSDTITATIDGKEVTISVDLAKDEKGNVIKDVNGNVHIQQYIIKTVKTDKIADEDITGDDLHDVTSNITTTKQGETQYVAPAEPDGYADYKANGSKPMPIVNEQGETIGYKEIEEIKDEQGNLIGYRIIETTERSTEDYTGADMAPDAQPEAKPDKFVLPTKPVVPNPKDDETLPSTAVVTEIKNGEEVVGYTTVDNGITTTTQVTEAKDENGKTIGWTTTTVVTDASGKEISYQSDTIYGTAYSYTKSETWDPETEKKYDINVTEIRGITRTDDVIITTSGVHTNVKDVTNDIYQLVNTETGTYFVYKGTVYAVKGTSKLTASDLTGGINLGQYGTAAGDDDDDLRLQYEAKNSGYYPNNYVNSNFGYSDNGEWIYDGFGMVSDFEVQGKTQHRVRLFKLKDGNQVRYAYCVELGANISGGKSYGSHEYKKNEDGATPDDGNAPWTNAEGTVAQLRSVALNGFWGTDDGLGSLQAVKDLMLRNGFTQAEADSLTPGMALAATQVAIWYFGSQDSSEFGTVGSTDAASGKFGLEYFHTDADDAVNQTTELAEKEDVVNKLRNLLVRLANDASGEGKAEVITKEKTFTEAGFVIHDKVINVEANTDGNENNDVYNTDVQFKLDVTTSSFNGDLIVKVLVGEEVVGAGRLAGSSKETDLIGNLLFDKIYPDESGVFTIPGLQLAENVKIDLKLEGTQHLDDGVYVFENASWQDFITLSKLENEVNFTMQMEFNVTDPGTADVSNKHSSWQETQNVAYKKNDTATQKYNGTETTSKLGERTEIYGKITIVETETQKTGSESEWRNHIPNPPGELRLARIFRLNNHNLVEIPEEPVPLATPAVTGDNSFLWIAVVMLSMFGMVAINFFGTHGKKGKYEAI